MFPVWTASTRRCSHDTYLAIRAFIYWTVERAIALYRLNDRNPRVGSADLRVGLLPNSRSGCLISYDPAFDNQLDELSKQIAEDYPAFENFIFGTRSSTNHTG